MGVMEDAFTKLVETVGSAVCMLGSGERRRSTSRSKGMGLQTGAEMGCKLGNYWLIFGAGTPEINILSGEAEG